MTCTRCHLHKTCKSVFIPTRGSKSPLVLFVGESPGREEDTQGELFVGESGEKLRELISRAGLHEDYCAFTSLIRCTPWDSPNKEKVRTPDASELSACTPYLDADIYRMDPVFVVPLGAGPTKYFVGKDVKIGQMRGKRYLLELPSLNARYTRMVQSMVRKGVHDHKLFEQLTDKSRENAIQRAVAEYGYKPKPKKQTTLFPTLNPASIPYNPNAEYDILSDLNFLVARLSGKSQHGDYELLTDVGDVVGYLRLLRSLYRDGLIPYVYYDIETTSLSCFDTSQYITTLGFSHIEGEAKVIPWDHHESPFKRDSLVQNVIREEFNKTFEEVPVAGHNIKYDYKFGAARGLWFRKLYDDTELMGWTLTNDTTPHDLEYLSSRYTDFVLPKQEMKQAKETLPKAIRENTDNYELDLIYRYNGADVDSGIRLLPALETELEAEGLLDAHRFYTVRSFFPTVDMEVNGAPIDQEFHGNLKDDMESQIQSCYDDLAEWGVLEWVEEVINRDNDKKWKPFKLSSPQQVCKLLFDLLSLPVIKRGNPQKRGPNKGKRMPSADKHVLQELFEKANEAYTQYEQIPDSDEFKAWELKKAVIEIIQRYKQVEQLYKMYIKNMPKHLNPDGYVRCNFGIRNTDSGRFNCKDPSLHTIPWHSSIKEMFVSRFVNGLILSADHGQAELRVFAMVTGDEALVNVFKNDGDVHRMIASRVLQIPEDQVPDDERRRIKTVVFGLLYGRGARSIAAQEGISVERAEAIIRGVFEQFPKVKDYIAEKHKEVRSTGQVQYVNGFRRLVPHSSVPKEVSRAQRISVNTSIQGPASDLAVLGMINMRDAMKKHKMYSRHWEFKHDDLAYDVAPNELILLAHMIQKAMVRYPSRELKFIGDVPLKVDFEIGINWGRLCGAKITGPWSIEIEGEADNIYPLLWRILNWSHPPKVISRSVKTKEKTAVVRSLMKSSGEMVKYLHVTVELEFQSERPEVEPEYAYPPMIQAA